MNSEQLENSVLESLRLVHQRYDQIASMTDELSKLPPAKNEFKQLHQKIQGALTGIETLQAQSKSLYDQYITSRAHASPVVRELTDQLSKKVQGLIVQFSNLENEARNAQKNLFPAVNENLRGVRMRSAYKRHTV